MTQLPIAGSAAGIPLSLAEQEIQFICRLAERCGSMAVDMRATVGIHEKDGPQDKVTDADLALSSILLKEMAARFPSDFLVSEEEVPDLMTAKTERIWYIDPIDGTDNYIAGDGQYSVMIGLLQNGRPHFGCVHSPAAGLTYFGGPDYGSFKIALADSQPEIMLSREQELKAPVRLMMGSRDRKNNPWLQGLPDVKIVSSGSVGLKVARIINDEADVFVHLSGKLKYWDTVGPIAIALGAGLESGTLQEDSISYPLAELRHPDSVVIGRKGTLAWARSVIAPRLTK